MTGSLQTILCLLQLIEQSSWWTSTHIHIAGGRNSSKNEDLRETHPTHQATVIANQPRSTSNRISLFLFLFYSHGCTHVLVHMWFSSVHLQSNSSLSTTELFLNDIKGGSNFTITSLQVLPLSYAHSLSICSLTLTSDVSDWILTERGMSSLSSVGMWMLEFC